MKCPTPLVSVLFGSAIPTFCSIFFFFLVFILVNFLVGNPNIHIYIYIYVYMYISVVSARYIVLPDFVSTNNYVDYTFRGLE